MTVREDEEMPAYFRQALIDRYEPWELVELLESITIYDIISIFEVDIMDYYEDLCEGMGIEKEIDDSE